ncbi:unnamed protein product [Larinioides sclopetarius]|uniref:Uncharacterized protein n=1 Tax=Larinioides sclopetarius TaxID=280406 RepID=A0AAV2A7D1_9ARAC
MVEVVLVSNINSILIRK